MRHVSQAVAMLRRWFGGGARDRTLHAELESFLEHEIDARMASGMTPEDARRTALAAFGGVQQVKEQVQEARLGAGLDAFVRDLRCAARTVRRSAGLSLAVVGSLSIGIAVTVVAYAFINAAMFRDLPGITDQERLIHLEIRRLPDGRPPGNVMSAPADYLALRSGLSQLVTLAASSTQLVAVELPEPRSILGLRVSENYFDVLGSHPSLGRTFLPEEGQPANAAVAVISHTLWRSAFNGDPAAIGRPIRVAGVVVHIVGVTSPGFGGAAVRLGRQAPDIWLPLAAAGLVSNAATAPDPARLSFVARLKDGVDAAEVLAAARVLASGLAAAAASQSGSASVSSIALFRPAHRPTTILIVMIIPTLVLVIACVNAASLTLARGSRQRREVAIRLAIGAGRGRVVRQLLLESVLLTCVAAGVALPLAWFGLNAAGGRLGVSMPIDATVLGWTLLTAAISAVASGLAPAFRVTAHAPLRALSVSRGAIWDTPAELRGKRAIVVAQVALAIGVLVSGTQLVALVEGQGGSGGTPADRLFMASFDLAQLEFPPDQAGAFYQRLLDGASRLPGTDAVGLARRTAVWTFGRGSGSGSVVVWAPGRRPEVVNGGYAGGDLFAALGLGLVAGRTFTAADALDGPHVAVVNRAYAEQLPERQALGRTIRVRPYVQSQRLSDEEALAVSREVTIVGVIESAGERRITQDGKPVGKIYLPSPLGPEPALTLYVRSRGRAEDVAPSVRALVSRIEPRVPIVEMGSLAAYNERSMGPEPWLARISALLGVVALVLAAAGLFAVVSYSVTQRAPEFAIRLALGANPLDLLRLVVAQSMTTVSIGFLLGGSLALIVRRLIAAQFHGAAGIDALAFGESSALLVAVMLLASAVPAIRAARVDPVANLKDG
jgi:putative ABC transport system permease protein